MWNAQALWKTLSGAADVVKSSPWREAGEDRYGLAAVGFSLRVLIHTHPTAASYTLPPSQWRSCCRSPELSYTVHLSTVSVLWWYFSFLSLFSPFCVFVALTPNNRRMNVLIELRVTLKLGNVFLQHVNFLFLSLTFFLLWIDFIFLTITRLQKSKNHNKKKSCN